MAALQVERLPEELALVPVEAQRDRRTVPLRAVSPVLPPRRASPLRAAQLASLKATLEKLKPPSCTHLPVGDRYDVEPAGHAPAIELGHSRRQQWCEAQQTARLDVDPTLPPHAGRFAMWRASSRQQQATIPRRAPCCPCRRRGGRGSSRRHRAPRFSQPTRVPGSGSDRQTRVRLRQVLSSTSTDAAAMSSRPPSRGSRCARALRATNPGPSMRSAVRVTSAAWRTGAKVARNPRATATCQKSETAQTV